MERHVTNRLIRACGWIPLVALPAMAVICRNLLPSWQFMWVLSFAVYFGLKWLTWWRVRFVTVHPAWRSAAYLFGWPGMDANAFLDASRCVRQPEASSWFWAATNTTLGAVLLWVVARSFPEHYPLVRGWVGMVGLILLLHFGLFHVVALLWQYLGVTAKPIMQAPLRSTSLREFWGKRWNLGFRQFAHELVFRPTRRRLGVRVAGLLVFVASGLIHDLVISLPARGGYGLPTLYFLIQGVGVMIERSGLGKSAGLAQGVRGWCFMIIFLVAPVFWLFHPWFVMRVILPFMRAIRAI